MEELLELIKQLRDKIEVAIGDSEEKIAFVQNRQEEKGYEWSNDDDIIIGSESVIETLEQLDGDLEYAAEEIENIERRYLYEEAMD